MTQRPGFDPGPRPVGAGVDRIDGVWRPSARVAGPRSDRLTDDRPLRAFAAVADSGCPPLHLGDYKEGLTLPERPHDGRVESKHFLHASVASLLTVFASGGIEFAMTGEWTPLIAGMFGVSGRLCLPRSGSPKWKKLISRVRKIGQLTQKRPLKTIAEGPTPDGTLPGTCRVLALI